MPTARMLFAATIPVSIVAQIPDWQAHERAALAAVQRQSFEDAQNRFTLALKHAATAGVAERRQASILANLAFVLATRGKFSEAERRYREAAVIYARDEQKDGLEFALVLKNLASLYMKAGRLPDAERELLRARTLEQRRQPAAALQLANTLHRLGEVLTGQNNYDAAIAPLRQALTVRSKILGTHADVARTTFLLARAYQEIGKYPESGQLWNAYIAMRNVLRMQPDADLVTAFNGYATAARHQGRVAEAEIFRKEAEALKQKGK